MDPDRPGLIVVVTDALGRPLRSPRRGGRAGKAGLGLASWLRRAAPAAARGTVGVAIVSDARVRALNRAYRGKDCTTDVLSFRASEPEVAQPFRAASAANAGLKPCATPVRYLGDIVIARGVARRQAREVRHGEDDELRVLALHGLLHLLGYDHERDDGRMRRLERRLLRANGVHAGLIERTNSARPSTGSGRASKEHAVRRRHARGEPVEPRAGR